MIKSTTRTESVFVMNCPSFIPDEPYETTAITDNADDPYVSDDFCDCSSCRASGDDTEDDD